MKACNFYFILIYITRISTAYLILVKKIPSPSKCYLEEIIQSDKIALCTLILLYIEIYNVWKNPGV